MRLICIGLVLSTHFAAKAQSDFYVTNDNDTLDVFIPIPTTFVGSKNFEQLFKSVKVIYTDGSVRVFKPGEINAFTIYEKKGVFMFETQQRVKYQLFSNKIKQTPAFLLRLGQGKNGAAFYRYEATADEGAIHRSEFYTFTRSIDTKLLFLHNADSRKIIRNRLHRYYSFIPNIQKATRRKFNNKKKMAKDVALFLNDLNK